ncbi:hypothetical protein NFI96_019111, partial [Prochilodus magdalenae]
MARNILCVWSCLISAFIYTGVHGDLEQETKEKDIQLFEKNNDFAFRLYKGIVAQPDSQSNNVFFSPLSVSTALAALSLGAGGQTHQELFSGLGFNSSGFTSEEVHQAFLSLLQSLNKRTGVDLDVGTALYVQDTFKPHAEFLEKMKRFYLSDGFSVDFTKTAQTIEQINKYVSEKTHDKISEFVEDLDPNTIMYLLSYIYFKGKWIKPFNPKYTEQKDFHVDNDTTVPVQMMFANKYFDVYHDQKVSAHALCLHYNDSFSMMLVLPDNSLSALEDVVSSQHVATWLGNMKSQRMARNILCLWSCLISAFIYTGVHGDLEQETKEKDIQLFEKNNDFAFRLYKGIVAQPDSQSNNVFFSPLSVSTALAALSLGAGGQTHQQLFSGLGFNSSGFTSEEVHQAFLSLLQSLNQRIDVDLEVGTALYVQDTFKPHAEFLEKMKRFYLSDGFSVDFTKTAQTIEQINKYVSEKTRDKISKFIKDLDPRTVMYLLSYIYFKGKWIMPFDPVSTHQGDFHVDNDTTVPVQMMYMKNMLDAYHDQQLSTHVLCLHYNDSFSMMLALPERGLSSLEETVSPQHIAKWLRSMENREHKIFVPKLSLKTSYSLKDLLTGMGMADMFTDKANFTGISSEEDLLVSK